MRDAKLKWCENHKEPVWVHDDGSFNCMWQLIVGPGVESQCSIVDQIPKDVLVPELKASTCSHSSFRWRCENSVSGWCEYSEDDACNDECLHCGEPEERK